MRTRVVPKAAPEQPLSPDAAAEIPAVLAAQLRRRRQTGPWRIDWATLLSRVFGIDVLHCSACGGRRRVIATISDGPTAKRILDHLGIKSTPLACSPARAPPVECYAA